MNHAALAFCTSSGRIDCTAAAWAKPVGAAVFAAALAALESWLRFPVQPLLDAGLQAARSFAASAAAALSRLASF